MITKLRCKSCGTEVFSRKNVLVLSSYPEKEGCPNCGCSEVRISYEYDDE